jgi:class 3 adenylate cyclase
MDVGGWLRKLGLEQYEPAFRENKIDSKILPKLTAEDLRDLGVTLVGDRLRLLDAIASLRDEAMPPGEGIARLGAAVRDDGGGLSRSDAERRQLTIMFCDLVGSTSLAARFDPEDLREVIGSYHRVVADTVGRSGGFVAKYMGDGVLVYFGYPQAHEDDAERAVRAGLAVAEAVTAIEARAPLEVRIGIATGLVVVGDLIGEGAAQERGVVGETPNLAARLQALARPGAIVIAEGTRRQIGRLFELDDLGLQSMAGFDVPQRAWRIVGDSGVVSRFEALRSGATSLVGRDEELDLLLRRSQQANSGEGRVVLLAGEPGIGKSRLVAELMQQPETEPHARLRYFCSPHHQDSALHPFIVQLERAAGFTRDDNVQVRLGKLEALLVPAARDRGEIELTAELLSLPNAAAELKLSPQRKRERLFEAMLSQVEALATARPVLMVFEDAHWIDPTSRELIDLCVNRVARLPMLLVITFRPEFKAPWIGQPHVTMLTLNRLSQRHVAALVLGLAGNAPLGSQIIDEIAERTDGVPLFIEELTKAVLERTDPDNRVAAVLSASPLPALAVPATLHASLTARLDRIGAVAKEIAQVGAVLGREFAYDLIARVAQHSEPELLSGLSQLTEAGLLFCHGQPPQSSYLFKHALVQDAAYATLLRSRRHELHARVARVLERNFVELVERQPELLAHHLTGAGATERAVHQWIEAGRHAAARSAHLEAIGHFDRGLAMTRSMSEGTKRDKWEIQLQLRKGVSLLTAKGFASEDAVEPFDSARRLCEKTGDTENLFAALWNVWLTTGAKDRNAARPLSDKLLTIAKQRLDDALLLQAHHSAWANCFFAGEPAPALRHCDEGRRIYKFDQHRLMADEYGGHDAGVCGYNFAAWSEWLLGYPDKAVASSSDGRHLAERLAHPLTLNHAAIYQSALHLFRGEMALALQGAREVEAFAKEQRLAPLIDPIVLQGYVLLRQHAVADGLALIGKRNPVLGLFCRPYHLAIVAEAHFWAEDYDEARSALAEARVAMEAGGECWWEAEIHRVEGMVLLSRRDVAASEACFERALRVARHQRAKSLELRAATSMSRLWGEQGRRVEARELLAPIYDWFTEGFDTADLKEAGTLLAELA